MCRHAAKAIPRAHHLTRPLLRGREQPDDLLTSSVEGYKAKWPTLEFRSIGVNLADDFLPELVAATDDVDIALIFNNAGYIKTGFFAEGPMGAQLANHHVNATSVVQASGGRCHGTRQTHRLRSSAPPRTTHHCG